MQKSPFLPPKHPSPFRPSSFPKIDEPSPEHHKTLDEILDDLDEEKRKRDSMPNVRKMIDKFNSEENVVLRKRNSAGADSGETAGQHHQRMSYAESGDLNLLLEELCKVTSAPVLTPGVTSSLVTPNLTDDEVRAKILSFSSING